jgi:Zn finger protein HypA/HybF involved in hydrogenase expression
LLVCARCGKEKTAQQMIKNKSTKSGFGSYCRKCAVIQVRESRIKSGWVPYEKFSEHEYRLRRRWRRLVSEFKVSEERALELDLARLNGACEICGADSKRSGNRWKKLCIDHNHIMGTVRGILCNRCNSGLGKFQDSKDLLIKASQYLEKYEK